MPLLRPRKPSPLLRFGLLSLTAAILSACGGSGSDIDDQAACPETGPYACLSGETEPLYPFQWALNYAASYFKDFPLTFGGGMDLNVAPVHRQGIKGQGVNVLVLDTGTDLHNPDLLPNADFSMSWNFITQQHDPYPDLTQHPRSLPHGTAVAGMIAAAQNGNGVMGIAPRATLGAANLLSPNADIFAAFGGAAWSRKAHVINASYAADETALPYESTVGQETTAAVRGLKQLRDGKGAIYVKGAANSFDSQWCGKQPFYYDCTNPGNDIGTLESNAIIVAALNAQGQASSYSSAGSVIWITGMGGEYGTSGDYGEGIDGDGPAIFSTDVRGCDIGDSNKGAETPFLRGETQRNGIADNPECNYSYMNGTSSATPTISGVVALMLSANPNLTWRDVRDILRLSARKVDADYANRVPQGADLPYGSLFNLSSETRSAALGSPDDIRDGALAIPTELGWQRNGAGYDYANWYGFGVPDALQAVSLAQAYERDPARSRTDDVATPPFRPVASWQLTHDAAAASATEAGQFRSGAFPYRRVTALGALRSQAQTVDQFQVRLSGTNVCLGSLGLAVRSPSGTVSLLKLPKDHFKALEVTNFTHYALSSVAFHGEAAEGDWELLAIAANPDTQVTFTYEQQEYQSPPCPTLDASGAPLDFTFSVEARIIAQ